MNDTPVPMPSPDDRAAAKLALDTGADARSRGLRTLFQFLIVELVVTVIPTVLEALDDETLDLRALVKGAIRSALGAVLAIAMRYRFPPPAVTG